MRMLWYDLPYLAPASLTVIPPMTSRITARYMSRVLALRTCDLVAGRSIFSTRMRSYLLCAASPRSVLMNLFISALAQTRETLNLLATSDCVMPLYLHALHIASALRSLASGSCRPPPAISFLSS